MNDPLILPHRAREAQRIYQELMDMTEAMHITDAVIAYLSSSSFLWLVFILVVGRVIYKIFGVSK